MSLTGLLDVLVLLPAKTMSYVCVEGGGKEEERERNEIYIFIEYTE